ncbi:MAG: hypothetical protein KGK07_16030 [Chloroflexota bacterium]|nr:hypothetical protein [Chloroflexota bacterium]
MTKQQQQQPTTTIRPVTHRTFGQAIDLLSVFGDEGAYQFACATLADGRDVRVAKGEYTYFFVIANGNAQGRNSAEAVAEALGVDLKARIWTVMGEAHWSSY